MKSVCRKSGFPVECPKCRQLAGRPNGNRATVAWETAQQVRCHKRQYQWTWTLGDAAALFYGLRLHVSAERLLQAFACVVLGLSLDWVEKRVGIKAETIKSRLLGVLRAERWELLNAILAEPFGITELERQEFGGRIVVGRELELAPFPGWGREFRRLDPRDQAKLLRHVNRILRGSSDRIGHWSATLSPAGKSRA